MTQSILLTGSNGFTGKAVSRALSAKGFDVLELSGLTGSSTGPLSCDLSDRDSVFRALKGIKVDRVIHLAAISFVASADTQEFYRTNVVGTCNLLDVLMSAKHRPQQVIVASSSNVYGVPGTPEPLTEQSPLAPVNHYACSKMAMEFMVKTYQSVLPITITRPFNYTGGGQADHFLVPKIVSHFAKKQPVIELGNLDISRDFTSIHDVVNAYLAIIESGVTGEVFNICSGVSVSLRSIVDELIKLSGHTIEVRSNADFIRANEIKTLCGDSRKLQRMTGWRITQPFSDVLSDMLSASER